MKVHLVDGTYELFRAYFALPSFLSPDGRETAAVRGLMRTLLSLLRQEDVNHLGCAFDHVIESFRNRMFPGYKTGEGIAEDLLVQFPLAERAAASLGIVVWPMVEFEADDAIATAAVRFSESPEVDQVVICSPDKDLTQVVRGQRVVCPGPPAGHCPGRTESVGKVWRSPGIHTGLPWSSRGCRRWDTGHSQVGSQDRRNYFEPLPPYRNSPSGPIGVGCKSPAELMGSPPAWPNTGRRHYSTGSWPPSGWTWTCRKPWNR